MPAGRPSKFTKALASKICERIAAGESVREICRDDAMPSSSMVFRWLANDKDFREQYAKAKEMGAEAMADEIVAIADDGTNDWMERNSADGASLGWIVNGEAIGRSRLRVDARKWVLSKLLPKKYGDKTEITHGVTSDLATLMEKIDGRTRGIPQG